MTAATNTVGCVEYATAVLGDKWTPLLLRHFMNEPTVRFCQLQELTGGINPRTLSARLSDLEENGIIIKETRGSINRCEYSLTKKGQDLMPILHDMQQWSTKYAPQTVSQN
jgi:DNA-binding HxlR family transcriptional regulator